jgi:predicted DNA-binding WGR domain protein|tara:strand:- start:150 stop:266 length:117 start_codon:yes stop_codon:yes gene_type:complete
VREWGRIGHSEQIRADWFETEADAKEAWFALQRYEVLG